MSDPLVSVIIINWNHGWCLENCLEALVVQEGVDFEILLIDNASKDGSVEKIIDKYPIVRIIRNPKNYGFSKAMNLGIMNAKASLILSLNPDVTVRQGFIKAMVNAVCCDKTIGSAAPKLLRADEPDRIDSTGLFLDRRRRPWDRGQNEPDLNQYNENRWVFGPCGGAALYKREMLEDVRIEDEFFDQDFFAYYEDVDLAWRAQSRGWKCVFVPNAIALHVRGWGDTLRKGKQTGTGPRLALRNRWLMTIKNDSASSFIQDLPVIFITEISRLGYALFINPSYWLGLADLIRFIPSALRKRRVIDLWRKVDGKALRHWFLVRDRW